MSDTPPRSEPSDLSVLTARARLPAELANASGMQKLDWFLSHPAPEELVASLPPDELYYWLRDIGRDDAYPLLEYATEQQLMSLVDIDTWSRHELSIPRWLEWLDLALAVDHDTAQRFVAAQPDELYTWLVTGDLRVLPADADIDQIPDELAFFPSPDGLYIVTVPREHPLEERLPQLMKLLWSSDTDRARTIFQQAQFDLHENAAEELERFRNGRLQDLGFEPLPDALEVYSVIPIKALRTELEQASASEAAARAEASPLAQPPAPEPSSSPTTDLVLRGVEPPDLLRAAVAALDERDRRTFGNGFAYLANKVLMAEHGDLSRLDELPEAARQAAALANLGLCHLALESPERAAVVVRQVTPETLFKAGWTLVFNVAKKARRLYARAGQDRGYHLFGAPTDEVLLHMSALRPRYAEALDDPGALGSRPIATLEELARIEARIDEASHVLDAFERHFGLTLSALDEGELPGIDEGARRRIRLTTLVRTGLAHFLAHDEFRFAPLTRDAIVAFSRAAFTADAKLTPALAERIELLVASQLEGASEAEREAFESLVRRAVDELVESLGPVHERDLDLRYAGELFLVTP